MFYNLNINLNQRYTHPIEEKSQVLEKFINLTENQEASTWEGGI